MANEAAALGLDGAMGARVDAADTAYNLWGAGRLGSHGKVQWRGQRGLLDGGYRVLFDSDWR